MIITKVLYTQRLVKEVLAQNHSFEAFDIRRKFYGKYVVWILIIDISLGAAYTYYKTLTQQESLERRGKLPERNKQRRRRQRLLRVRGYLYCDSFMPYVFPLYTNCIATIRKH